MNDDTVIGDAVSVQVVVDGGTDNGTAPGGDAGGPGDLLPADAVGGGDVLPGAPVAEGERRTRSESLKAYWADPANRERHSTKLKAKWANSETSVSLARKRSIRIKDQYGVEYDSVNDAARKLGLHASNIRAHLRGRVQRVKSYVFTLIALPEGR